MKLSSPRAKLATAVMVAMGTALASTGSLAVNLSDNGLGEVGIVPYYTVRNSLDTYISVVNTSNQYTVAFKIRFRESDNSRDARDFNVFLSPDDVWTGVVTMGPDGQTPVIQTADNSCTAPALSEAAATMPGMRGVGFTNIGYAGGSNIFPKDPGSNSIERAQEGYIEVIAMGVADPADSSLAAAAVHGPNGVPANCGQIIAAYVDPNRGNAVFEDQFSEPLNVLKVDAYMLRVDAGVGTGLPVTTLANFFNPDFVEDPDNPAADNLMDLPESAFPNLGNADPVSDQVVEVLGAITDTGFATGYDAVSSLMTATAVINEYAIGGAALAKNDWVITFPTKNFYVDTTFDPAAPIDPFEQPFQAPGQSCVNVAYNYFDREERFVVPPDECTVNPTAPQCQLNFSPRPPDLDPETPVSAICQEVQTLSFADVPVLGSGNNYGVPLESGFTSGWMRLQFPATDPANPTTTPIQGDFTYFGLPTIGFSVKTLENGVASTQGVLNYAVASPHAYTRVVSD